MNLLAPGALIFAAAIPVVILFYLLKRKRTVQLVSSTLLWQKFLAETQANAPFQKLRHHWLLLLQILLLTLVILALARPYFARKTQPGRLRVVILDASASMQATDETPSRFEKARQEALSWVDGLQDTDQMLVLQAGAVTEVKQSGTREKASLRRAIQSCAVTDSGTHLREALKLAETLTRDQPSAEIHLFSDGAAADLNDFESKNLPLIYHQIGHRAENVGIISLDIRTNPENAAQRAVFASVANYGSNRQPVQLEVTLQGRLVETRPLILGPRETSPQVFLVGQTNDAVLAVRLNAKDDLAVDNEASMVSLMPQPAKTLLITRGNRFLEKALRSAPNVQLEIVPDLRDPNPVADLVVLDDVSPSAWPNLPTLALHTVNSNWFGQWSKSEAPAIVDWKNNHPLLRFVGFENVQIAETLAVKNPPWGIALVDSTQTPLILAGELQKKRLVWVGFDVLQSTWPLRISFPIFIANAVEWLNPAAQRSSQLMVSAGQPFRLVCPQRVTTYRVTFPDGRTETVANDSKNDEIFFGQTQHHGLYHLQAGTNDVTFAVNLLDAGESDITPRAELQLGKYAKVQNTTLRSVNLEFWRWAAMAGLLVLLGEWWYYHRRTV